MNSLYRQTCINGHPATVSPDNGKPWRCGDPECEYFDGADDTAYGEDAEAQEPIDSPGTGRSRQARADPIP